MHELILGGQKSGKPRCAERRAAAWLSAPARCAILVATGLADDAEMRLHQALASLCSRVTLLVAGIALPVKREAR